LADDCEAAITVLQGQAKEGGLALPPTTLTSRMSECLRA